MGSNGGFRKQLIPPDVHGRERHPPVEKFQSEKLLKLGAERLVSPFCVQTAAVSIHP